MNYRHLSFFPLLIIILTLSVYIFFAGRLKFEFPTHRANYFSHLVYSLISGRLDLISAQWNHDLSSWQGKMYMYWGPTPVLLVSPFILIFGLNFSDALYTAILASLNPLLLYFILQELEKLNIININDFKKFLLSIFLGFGTVHFILSVNGGVWFTSQVLSIFYILLATLFILKFKRINNIFYLILSATFLSLGIWGRNPCIFYLPFFLIVIISAANYLRNIFLFLFISLVFISIAGGYNYLRFGSFVENGFTYSNMNAFDTEKKDNFGMLNAYFIPNNFYYMFQRFPEIKLQPPFLVFDYQGNSILFTSPLFIVLILFLERRYWVKKIALLNLSLLFCLISIITFFLLFFATGWLQFGYRYLNDAMPAALILLSQVIADMPNALLVLLILVSVIINTMGVFWFLQL